MQLRTEGSPKQPDLALLQEHLLDELFSNKTPCMAPSISINAIHDL